MSKKITTIVEEYVGDDTDALKMTIPLFIRLLEFAREDAKSDVDLHKLTIDEFVELQDEVSSSVKENQTHSIIPRNIFGMKRKPEDTKKSWF